ncbi:MAG: NAD(P)-binding protein [Actinomycetota bacterium]
MADYDVVVIGAGLGGLTAGTLLAREGRRTLVLEQGGSLGGRCSTYEREGFRGGQAHDWPGAQLHLRARGFSIRRRGHHPGDPGPPRSGFPEAGAEFREEVSLEPCDPVYGVIFPDGSPPHLPRFRGGE